MISARVALLLVLPVVLASTSGCSMRSLAAETIGDMLASGDSVFTNDDDVELIGEALPFSIKLVESLIAESPRHRRLLLTAARSYALYAYAYVQVPAEQVAAEDLAQSRRLRARARNLYLRGFRYAVRVLEIDHPGIGDDLLRAPEDAVSRIGADRSDVVPALYWSASALGLAISVSKNDPAMLARLPEVDALLTHALALDEDYDDGVLHEFAMVWAEAVPGAATRDAVDHHYQRALDLSAGQRASVYVNYAVAKAVPSQNRELFDELLALALAIDPNSASDDRLLNSIAQRRARWLSAHAGELFLE